MGCEEEERVSAMPSAKDSDLQQCVVQGHGVNQIRTLGSQYAEKKSGFRSSGFEDETLWMKA